MKFRPFTFLLLILLLLAGVCAASYHLGYFDAFFAEETDQSQPQVGDGPVVRREVSKLVLPLESAGGQDVVSGEELNETEISALGSPVAGDAGEQTGQEIKAAAPGDQSDTPAEKAAPEPVANAQPNPEPKPAAAAKPASAPAGGELKGVKTSCQNKKAVVSVLLSSAAGKVNWFNLDSPRRLVVDMHGKWDNSAKSVYRIKNCPVSKVVLGEHPDKIRLVIYLDPNKFSAKVKPVVRRLDNAISLELGF